MSSTIQLNIHERLAFEEQIKHHEQEIKILNRRRNIIAEALSHTKAALNNSELLKGTAETIHLESAAALLEQQIGNIDRKVNFNQIGIEAVKQVLAGAAS